MTQTRWRDMSHEERLAFCRAHTGTSYEDMAFIVRASRPTLSNFVKRFGIERTTATRKPVHDPGVLLNNASRIWSDHKALKDVAAALHVSASVLERCVVAARATGDDRFPLFKAGRPRGPAPVPGPADYAPHTEPYETIEEAFLRECKTKERLHRAMTAFPAGFKPATVSLNAYQSAQLRMMRCGFR
jgi:hypothetical protein